MTFLSLLRSEVNLFIGQCLAGWYGNSSVRIFSGRATFRLNLFASWELNKGQFLAPLYLITAIRTATRFIPPYVIKGIDIRH